MVCLNIYKHEGRNTEYSPERGFPGLLLQTAATSGNQTALLHSQSSQVQA